MSDADSPIFENSESLGSTSSVGQTTDEGKGRIFPCESCGADLKFHIGVQHLKCPFCGHEKEIEIPADSEIEEQDFHAMLQRMERLHEKDTEGNLREDETGQNEVRCESCGGTVVFLGTLTSSECAYCGSPIQRENVHTATRRIPVDGVLPFLVDRDHARTNLAAWVKSRWFAPNDFLKRGIDGKFHGVYLPFWTYDSFTFNRYRGERGEHYWVTVGSGKNQRQVRRTRWYSASGEFQRFFDDVLVLAGKGLPEKYMIALEPWPLFKCVPFNQQMLAGHFARTYDISLSEGFGEAKSRIATAITQEVHARIGGDEQRIHSLKTWYSAITFKHLLLPTWLMAYRYKEQVYQLVVNAATGEVQGQRPYSWVKITLAILGGLTATLAIAFFASR